jgi:hypothetical protein
MSTAVQITPATSVRFERLLPGPIERVWDYLTKPDLQAAWLAESTADVREITQCQPLRSVEYSMRDSSVVSLELEPRGKDVLLVLTHRRFPGWVPEVLAGAGTALAVALLVFSFFRTSGAARSPQGLGPPILTLKISSSETRPLYAMLGGRC